MKRIGIYPGAFNPFHNGHMHVAETCIYEELVDSVIVMPDYKHPFKKEINDEVFRHTYKMCELVIREGLLNPNIMLSDYRFQRPEILYIYDLMKSLPWNDNCRELNYLIIGRDSLLDLHRWHKAENLIKEIPMVVVNPMSNPKISSSDIREDIESNKKHLLPSVYEYIKEKGVYKK